MYVVPKANALLCLHPKVIFFLFKQHTAIINAPMKDSADKW